MDGVENVVITSLVFYGVLFLVSAGACVCLGLCVYNDALYRRNSSAGMWGILSGFFAIAALVYIILQLTGAKKPKPCVRCYAYLAPDAAHCPYCGTAVYTLPPETAARHNARRKMFFALWIILYVLTIAATIAWAGLIFTQLRDMFPNGYYYGARLTLG